MIELCDDHIFSFRDKGMGERDPSDFLSKMFHWL